VAQFANDALSNALHEFEQSGRIETPATIEAAIVKLARASKTTNVVMSAAPVGPVADTIAALIPALAKHGITLRQTHRPYDSLCWPHATKGFFAMKKQIPSILRQLNLAG
jgi:deoxyribodipyrimidine photo-lyase